MGIDSITSQRKDIRVKNPDQYYDWGDEIGRGKFAVVKKATKKETGEDFAVKMIKYDSESIKFAIREYDLMVSGDLADSRTVKLHEAYLVRSYLILIIDLVDGKTMLDKVSHMHSLTEDDVAGIVTQLLETLATLHSNNVVHLDLRPTNIRFSSGRNIKLLDYNSARVIANKKAGAVVDLIGDTEFCAPELLNFDPVSPGSDMWSVGVLTYILLSGISPFYYEDEDKVLETVQLVKWQFDPDAFESVTPEAKDFIKKLLIRAPEMRMTVSDALAHKWLSDSYQGARKRSVLSIQDTMRETDERLYSEEEEDYIEAALVFRTFDEEPYIEPEEDDEED